MATIRDWALLERKWREQWAQYGEGWFCSCCGEPVHPINPSWRFTGSGYEHKCPTNDSQAGYFPAQKREK